VSENKNNTFAEFAAYRSRWKSSKTDEDGHAVHETCYTASLSQQSPEPRFG
jgi:hypothetical protein